MQLNKELQKNNTYKDKHKSELIAVLGNGPSITNVDLHLLANLTTVGCNYISKIYNPDYTVVLDRQTRNNNPELFRNNKSTIFYANPEEHWEENYYKYENYDTKYDEPYLSNSIQRLRWGHSSIIPAINLAYVLGARAIVLFGIDLYYNNHFYNETKQLFPNKETVLSELSWINDFCTETGFRIYNANPNSECRFFKFINFNLSFLRKIVVERQFILKGRK